MMNMNECLLLLSSGGMYPSALFSFDDVLSFG